MRRETVKFALVVFLLVAVSVLYFGTAQSSSPKRKPSATAAPPPNSDCGRQRTVADPRRARTPLRAFTEDHRTTTVELTPFHHRQREEIRASLTAGVPQCSATRNIRDVVAVLYDPATQLSHTEPPLSVDAITSVMAQAPEQTRRRFAVRVGEWPSQSADFIRARRVATESATPYVACVARHAVVTYAAKYGPDELQSLVSSFERYHTPCDHLVLFVDNIHMDLVRDEDKASLILQDRQSWESAANVTQSPDLGRVHVLALWATRHAAQYTYIVTTDARDVIFFGNAFQPLYRLGITNGLFSTSEVWGHTDIPFSTMWMARFLDEFNGVNNFLGNLKLHGSKFPVLCSGLYGGTSAAFVDYMVAFAQSSSKASAEARKTVGLDQGIHIYLQTAGLILARFPHPILVLDGEIGPYRHWYKPEHAIVRDANTGGILNCRGETYAVVHQADRYFRLWNQLRAPYRHFKTAGRGGEGNACPVPNIYQVFGSRRAGAQFQRTAAPASVLVKPGDDVRGMTPPAWVADAIATAMSQYQSAPPDAQRHVVRDWYLNCTTVNAILIVLTDDDGVGRAAVALAAIQRYHTACDTVVLFVEHGLNLDALALARATMPVIVERLATRANGTTPDLHHATSAPASVLWWLTQHASQYQYVIVLESLAAARPFVFGNLFAPMHDAAIDQNQLWFISTTPLRTGEENSALLDGISAVAAMPEVDAECTSALGGSLVAVVLNRSRAGDAAVPGIYGGSPSAVSGYLAAVVEILRAIDDAGCSEVASVGAILRSYAMPAWLWLSSPDSPYAVHHTVATARTDRPLFPYRVGIVGHPSNPRFAHAMRARRVHAGFASPVHFFAIDSMRRPLMCSAQTTPLSLTVGVCEDASCTGVHLRNEYAYPYTAVAGHFARPAAPVVNPTQLSDVGVFVESPELKPIFVPMNGSSPLKLR